MMNNPIMAALTQIMGMGQNPQAILQNMMAQNNPQMGRAMNEYNALTNQARQNGMNMEQVARQYAKQNGIDVNALMQMAMQNGGRM